MRVIGDALFERLYFFRRYASRYGGNSMRARPTKVRETNSSK